MKSGALLAYHLIAFADLSYLKEAEVEVEPCGRSKQFNNTTRQPPEILGMLDEFRRMLNDCVRIGWMRM
jgi:hypothetical protein